MSESSYGTFRPVRVKYIMMLSCEPQIKTDSQRWYKKIAPGHSAQSPIVNNLLTFLKMVPNKHKINMLQTFGIAQC